MINESRILSFLRYANALDKKRSVKLDDMARFINTRPSSLHTIIVKLSSEKKVFYRKESIWLTKLGFSISLKDYS